MRPGSTHGVQARSRRSNPLRRTFLMISTVVTTSSPVETVGVARLAAPTELLEPRPSSWLDISSDGTARRCHNYVVRGRRDRRLRTGRNLYFDHHWSDPVHVVSIMYLFGHGLRRLGPCRSLRSCRRGHPPPGPGGRAHVIRSGRVPPASRLSTVIGCSQTMATGVTELIKNNFQFPRG